MSLQFFLMWCLVMPVLKMCLKKMSLTSTSHSVFHRCTFARAKRFAASLGPHRRWEGLDPTGEFLPNGETTRKLSIFETRCVSKNPSSFRYPTFLGEKLWYIFLKNQQLLLSHSLWQENYQNHVKTSINPPNTWSFRDVSPVLLLRFFTAFDTSTSQKTACWIRKTQVVPATRPAPTGL